MFQLEQQIESVFPVKNWSRVRTLVAVSGGADSVALLRAMAARVAEFKHASKKSLLVGHVNHQTRGAESESDAEFVRQLACDLDLDFLKGSASDHQSLDDSEESLREFRYEKLIKLSKEQGARYLVTGHNLDDQVETILFRIFRGTGISGLRGIPITRLANESTTIVRPLLGVSRLEIESYLKSLKQDFRVDASNVDSKYARNYLRNELIPNLKLRFGDSISQSVLRLGRQATEVEAFMNSQAVELDAAIQESSPEQLTLDCKILAGQSDILIRQWLNQVWIRQGWPRQSMSDKWWRRLSDGIRSDSELILNLPSGIRFKKKQSATVITLTAKRD